MSKRVLVIGLGGTGKQTLTMLKERLLETYGTMPENVALLALDTDILRDEDTFAGVQLSSSYDNHGREPEYKPIISEASITIDDVFADLRTGRTAAYMSWLEHNHLDTRVRLGVGSITFFRNQVWPWLRLPPPEGKTRLCVGCVFS